MLTNILVVVGTFLVMEFVAWFAHKYIMHGFLWFLHKDHHQKEPGFFEKNDAFFLIFAIPSALMFVLGSINGIDFKFFIGIGIALYGFAYFLVHEVFIHRRFRWFGRGGNRYFKAVQRAHHVHHSHLTKEGGENFGMLVVPLKYIRSSQRKQKA
jgi:beta-carotene 3-hydroxylase